MFRTYAESHLVGSGRKTEIDVRAVSHQFAYAQELRCRVNKQGSGDGLCV